jgi:hypothetical protein
MTGPSQLFGLLPAIYRVRDAENGGVLEALLSVIDQELGLVEENISQLYDDWFIETCQEWLVPYIGDLLGVRPLHPVPSAGVSLRAYTANTLAYRRRKGTVSVLESLSRDTTGWNARAIEFWKLLATTQHVNHVRLEAPGWASLRHASNLELIGGPFERVPYSADVRHIDTREGKYNIPNIGLFLWRLAAYRVTQGKAREVHPEVKPGRYTFNPLGLDASLFNPPQSETDIAHLAEELNVPGILRRRPLYDELEARRAALLNSKTPDATYFAQTPVFKVFEDGTLLKPEEFLICDFSDWDKPTWVPPNAKDSTKIGIDPHLGRLVVLKGASQPASLEVSYAYGFPGDLGGGPYNRRGTYDFRKGAPSKQSDPNTGVQKMTSIWHDTAIWQFGVSQQKTKVGAEQLTDKLETAIDEWNTWSAANPGQPGVIVLMDSGSYSAGPKPIEIPEGSQLLVIAADWPVVTNPVSFNKERRPGQFVTEDVRPCIHGDLSIIGQADPKSLDAGELLLNGLLIEGHLNVQSGNLKTLELHHCTIQPGPLSLSANGKNDQLHVVLERCICGVIDLPDAVRSLTILESLIDPEGTEGRPSEAIRAPTVAATINASTVLGTTQTKTLNASDTIFEQPVTVIRRQTGCVRFSYLAPGSRTPRAYRCQPELEISRQLEEAKNQDKVVDEKIVRGKVSGWLKPNYTSSQYGHPAYGQLTITTPRQIKRGADQETEMGTWRFLMQPQREDNLRIALDEYLRFGLEAGLIFVT